MSAHELLQISAPQLASSVLKGELSPVDIVNAHIARIEEVNPAINALVADRFTAARAEAQSLERELRSERSERRGALPLAGVPFTVKEMISVSGMPHTFGCRNREGRRATLDATVVARLRAAGAIVLGVSNVPEWGMWFESFNALYGRTNNPWSAARTCGGSSGGEGALVGAGGSVFGLGTDIGGSVRMPAAFCGVYAHKPSHGMLPLTGTFPVYADESTASQRSPYLTIGAFARSPADLALLLRVMAGSDGVDPNARGVTLHDSERVEWRGRRVVLLPAPHIQLAARAAAPLVDAVKRAGRWLHERGADVVEAPADLLHDAGDAWFASLQSVGGPAFGELLGEGARVHLLREAAATMVGRGRYSWPALYFLAGEKIGRKGARALERALQQRDRMAQRVAELTGADGVVVCPVHPRVAPRHNAAVLRPFDFLYTAAFNALRMPASVAPIGFDADNLPLSVQIAAADGNDHLTLAAAAVVREMVGPWRPAPVLPGAVA